MMFRYGVALTRWECQSAHHTSPESVLPADDAQVKGGVEWA
jgi:hypothetical protein